MNNKKCSNLSVLLFSILATHVGYADSGSEHGIVEIQTVQLAKVIGGLRVFDLGKNRDGKSSYKVTFSKRDNCFNPKVNLLGNNADTISNLGQQTATSKNVGRFASWNIGTGVVEAGFPTSYSIVFDESSDSRCEKMEGSMPEIQVGLTDADQDGNRKLTLTNTSSHAITLTGIEKTRFSKDNKYIGVNPEDLTDKIINERESLEVDFNPSVTCPPGVVGKVAANGFYTPNQFYKFTIGYKINGETDAEASEHKFEIYVFRTCVLNSLSKEQITDELKEPAAVPQTLAIQTDLQIPAVPEDAVQPETVQITTTGQPPASEAQVIGSPTSVVQTIENKEPPKEPEPKAITAQTTPSTKVVSAAVKNEFGDAIKEYKNKHPDAENTPDSQIYSLIYKETQEKLGFYKIKNELEKDITEQAKEALSLAIEGKFFELRDKLTGILSAGETTKNIKLGKLKQDLGTPGSYFVPIDFSQIKEVKEIIDATNGILDEITKLKMRIDKLEENIKSDNLTDVLKDLTDLKSDIDELENAKNIVGFKTTLGMAGKVWGYYNAFDSQKAKVDSLFATAGERKLIIARGGLDQEISDLEKTIDGVGFDAVQVNQSLKSLRIKIGQLENDKLIKASKTAKDSKSKLFARQKQAIDKLFDKAGERKVPVVRDELGKEIMGLRVAMREENVDAKVNKDLETLRNNIDKLENDDEVIQAYKKAKGLKSSLWQSWDTQLFSDQKTELENLKKDFADLQKIFDIKVFDNEIERIQNDILSKKSANDKHKSQLLSVSKDLKKALSDAEAAAKNIYGFNVEFSQKLKEKIEFIKAKIRKIDGYDEIETSGGFKHIDGYVEKIDKFIDVQNRYKTRIDVELETAIQNFKFTKAKQIIDEITADSQYKTSILLSAENFKLPNIDIGVLEQKKESIGYFLKKDVKQRYLSADTQSDVDKNLKTLNIKSSLSNILFGVFRLNDVLNKMS